MAADFDLSNLRTEQIDLWICLQVLAILDEIKAAQAERLGFPLALGGWTIPAVTVEPPAGLYGA